MKLGLIGHGKMGKIYAKYHDFVWTMDPAGPCDHVSMAMLRNVDGVVVASPTKTHAAYVTLLGSSGIPVLVEKPMTCSLESAEHIVKKGWDVFVSQPVRYDWPTKPEGLETIRRGGVHPGSDYVSVLWDLAVHDSDILQFWGESIEVLGWLGTESGNSYLIDFPSADILCSWGRGPERTYRAGAEYAIPSSGTAIGRQLEDFLLYLSSGRLPERLCTAVQALNVIRVIDSIQNASTGDQ